MWPCESFTPCDRDTEPHCRKFARLNQPYEAQLRRKPQDARFRVIVQLMQDNGKEGNQNAWRTEASDGLVGEGQGWGMEIRVEPIMQLCA